MPPLPPDLDPAADDVFERIEAARRADAAGPFRRGFALGVLSTLLALLLGGLWLA